MSHPIRNRKGFTLIELLTVIAIIGILAAVLFPGVQGVMKAAKKSAASTKLANIGKAYVNFNNSGGGGKYIKSGTWAVATSTSAGSISDFAAVLAYNVDLNQAELWYVDADPANDTATPPKQILTGAAGAQTINTAFSTQNADNGYISWAGYAPVPKNISTDIPLLWTRGLDTAGAWSATKGVWGAEGGHMVFGDAHVTWLANTSEDANKFASKKTPGTTTVNWTEAVTASTAPTELKSSY